MFFSPNSYYLAKYILGKKDKQDSFVHWPLTAGWVRWRVRRTYFDGLGLFTANGVSIAS